MVLVAAVTVDAFPASIPSCAGLCVRLAIFLNFSFEENRESKKGTERLDKDKASSLLLAVQHFFNLEGRSAKLLIWSDPAQRAPHGCTMEHNSQVFQNAPLSPDKSTSAVNRFLLNRVQIVPEKGDLFDPLQDKVQRIAGELEEVTRMLEARGLEVHFN